MPQEGDLEKLSVVIQSIKGDITVNINKQSQKKLLYLKSPYATKAIVGIPKSWIANSQNHTIAVDNTVIWKSGSSEKHINGIKFINETDKYINFGVESEIWEFLVE